MSGSVESLQRALVGFPEPRLSRIRGPPQSQCSESGSGRNGAVCRGVQLQVSLGRSQKHGANIGGDVCRLEDSGSKVGHGSRDMAGLA